MSTRHRRPWGIASLVVVVLLVSCAKQPEATFAEPYKVTVAGDSISFGLGAAIRTQVSARPNSVTKVIGIGGTGLARPDNFDWPSRLDTLAAERPPKVLVVSVGSNDAQDLTDAAGTTTARFAPEATDDGAEWNRSYSARLARIFDTFRGSATTVVWVGQVRTGDDRVGSTNRRIHRLAVALAAERPWVTVADLGQLLGSNDAVATDCLLADNLHLKVSCYERAAEQLNARFPPQGL
ncbi:MAG: GDSL-type esterase/lipase family protein [Actinomycetes bacterium]